MDGRATRFATGIVISVKVLYGTWCACWLHGNMVYPPSLGSGSVSNRVTDGRTEAQGSTDSRQPACSLVYIMTSSRPRLVKLVFCFCRRRDARRASVLPSNGAHENLLLWTVHVEYMDISMSADNLFRLLVVAYWQIENRVCLGLTLATLPGVKVQPFYLADMDVPDPLDPPSVWRRAVRLRDGDSPAINAERALESSGQAGLGDPIFMTYATTTSIDALGEYMEGLDAAFPRSQKIGTIASTVSRCETGKLQMLRCVFNTV